MYASEAQLKAMNPVHIVRGLQLAWLGIVRGLQNPKLYTSAHYKQLVIAALTGLALHFFMLIPIYFLRGTIATTSLFVDLRRASWEEDLYRTLTFVQHWVVSVPFLMLNFFRNIEPTPFDELFMESMRWVDHIYLENHEGESKQDVRAFYITTLEKYTPKYRNTFWSRTLKRVSIGLLLYILSFTPKVGRLVLPGVSFYTLHRAVGLVPAAAVFMVATAVLPRHYFVIVLQTYFSVRSLTRQLLQPYFARVGSGFTTYQKAKWFREREGVLFGFTLPFFLLMRVNYVGVLAYGVASASAAFLVSKVTRPPPENHAKLTEYVDDEVLWTQGRKNLIMASWKKLLDFDMEGLDFNQESKDDFVKSESEIPILSPEDDPILESKSRKSSRGSSDEEWVKLTQSTLKT